MKKTKFLIILMFNLYAFSQNKYTYMNGGRILENGKKINPTEIRNLLINNQRTLELYESGRVKKTFGNVLIYSGLATLISKYIYDLSYSPKLIGQSSSSYNYGPYNNTAYINSYTYEPPPSKTMYVVGGILIVVAIPIKAGFSKRIKKAVVLMNQDSNNPKTTFIESSDIIANSNGIGLSINF